MNVALLCHEEVVLRVLVVLEDLQDVWVIDFLQQSELFEKQIVFLLGENRFAHHLHSSLHLRHAMRRHADSAKPT